MFVNCVLISWSGTDGDIAALNCEESSSLWRRGAARSDCSKTPRHRHSAIYVCSSLLDRGDDDRHHVHLIGKENRWATGHKHSI